MRFTALTDGEPRSVPEEQWCFGRRSAATLFNQARYRLREKAVTGAEAPSVP